jgi:hypothetical protein
MHLRVDIRPPEGTVDRSFRTSTGRSFQATTDRSFRTTVDTADGPPVSTVLLEGVAEVIGTEAMLRKPPLYEVIEPDALDALFDHIDQSRVPRMSVAFEFAGCEIDIRQAENAVQPSAGRSRARSGDDTDQQ